MRRLLSRHYLHGRSPPSATAASKHWDHELITTRSRSVFDVLTTYVMNMICVSPALRQEILPKAMTRPHTRTPSSSNIPYRFIPRIGAQMKNYFCWKALRLMVWDHGPTLRITLAATEAKTKSLSTTEPPTSKARSSLCPKGQVHKISDSLNPPHAMNSTRAKSAGSKTQKRLPSRRHPRRQSRNRPQVCRLVTK